MTIDYQIIIDMIANMGIVVFPIALLFVIVGKITQAFLSFVRGDRRVKL